MKRQVLFVFGSQGCVAPAEPLLAARKLGCRTAVLAPSMPCEPSAEALIDRFAMVNLSRVDAVVETARKLYHAEPVHGVVGYDDQAVPIVARIAAALGLPGHPVSAADAARDKVWMKERLAAAGVPIATYVLAGGEDDAVRWAREVGSPVVVKPVRGAASQGVIRANNDPDLREAYRRVCRIVRDYGLDTGGRPYTEQLVERYLDGSEVSVEVLVKDGTPHVLCIFEKPQPLHGPFFEETIYVTPTHLSPEQRCQVEELAIRAAGALGLYHGVAHCEIRLSSEGPFVLEIAARVIGGACSQVLSYALGEDIHSSIIRLALGEDFPLPRQQSLAAGAMMLPIPEEGRLMAVRGVDQASKVPGIQDVIIRASPGDIIRPFPEQGSYVGILTAVAETPTGVTDILLRAAGEIALDLEPVVCEYWVREITDHRSYEPSPHYGIRSLSGHSVEEAREIIIPLVAAAYFGELPPHLAQAKARQCVSGLEAGERGETSPDFWLVADGRGVALGSFCGDTCYVSCIGVVPGQRLSGLGEALGRSIMALFARRGCTKWEVHLDPRQPAAVALYRRLGFVPLGPDAAACDTCC